MPGYSRPIVERLYCEECSRAFERVIKRGRKPSYCPPCRRFLYPVTPNSQKRPTVAISKQDPKIDAGMLTETNDCTVRAVSIATGAPYREVHAFFKANGRKSGQGVYFEGIVNRHSGHLFGHALTRTSVTPAKGVRTLLLRNPHLAEGTWILGMTGHVACLRDGVLLDSWDSSRKQTTTAWLVTKA